MDDKLNKIPEKIINFKNWKNILAISIVGYGYLLTTGCTDINAQEQINTQLTVPPIVETLGPIPSDPTIENTISPSSLTTPTEVPTQIIEPILMPTQDNDVLAVNPPNFNLENQNLPHGSFDLIDSHAVYALYRQQQGPAMWSSDADFTADMASYAAELKKQGMDLKQASVEGQTFSLLTRDNDILLNFDTDGALKDRDPGRWSTDSTPEWIDAGGPVELFIGEDNHAYIAKVDADGNVIAFLSPIGATRDNLDQQWITVTDGYPDAFWSGKEWETEIPIVGIANWRRKLPTYGTYTLFTESEIASFPTPITWADMHRIDMGPALRAPQFASGKEPGIWLLGKIVAVNNPGISPSPENSKITEVVFDVPLQSVGILRITASIQAEYFDWSSYYRYTFLQTAIHLFADTGYNPLSPGAFKTATDMAIAEIGWKGICNTIPGTKTIDKLTSDPDNFGLPFGMLLHPTAPIINPQTGYPDLSEGTNSLWEYFLDQTTTLPNQVRLDQTVFVPGLFIIPDEWCLDQK